MGFVIENDVLEKCIMSEDETEVVIPEGVKIIGYEAFYKCKNLKSVVISEGVEEIGDSAFYYCENLENITIPKSVRRIGACAFLETKWEDDKFKQSPFIIINNILADVDREIEGDVRIPDSVTEISENGLSNCYDMKRLEIPESVKIIGDNALEYCIALEEVIIPDTVEEIGRGIFFENVNLKNIVIKGKYINIRINVDYDEMYREPFPAFVSAKGIKKENFFNEIVLKKYKIPCALILLCKYDNKTAEKYIMDNIKETVEYIILNSDAKCLTRVLNFIGAGEIDRLIKYAIEQKKPELQVILSNYKNDNFGFDADFEKYKL